MLTFEEHLMGALQQHLEQPEFRYTDNSPAYYYSHSVKAEEEDREFFRQLPAISISFEQLRKQLDERIRFEVALKADLYDMLEDDYSRNTLVLVAAYGILGHRFVKFPYYRSDNIEKRSRLHDESFADAPNQEIAHKAGNDEFGIGYRNRFYDATAAGRNFKLYTTAEFLLGLSGTPQYVYGHDGTLVRAEPGDFVLDCGACAGDTAIMFADDVGPEGKVFSFEAHPQIALLLRHNININSRLRKRIIFIPKAVSNTPNGTMQFTLQGASSGFMTGKPREGLDSIEVATTTIDHEVAERKLPRLDFIKMDIEGAELEALMGAENTIRRFRPKLAVCLYHNFKDFRTIPAFLRALKQEYRYFLDHHAVNAGETVLYASPANK